MTSSFKTGNGDLIISSGCKALLTEPSIVNDLSRLYNYGSVTLYLSSPDVLSAIENYGYMNITG